MENLGSVSVWLPGLSEGDEQAQYEIFRRYQPQLLAYAASRLRQMGVHHTEADDIAQTVFLGLFRRAASGSLPDLTDRNQLWLKLRRICGDRVKEQRRKRTIQTESALGISPDGDSPSPLELPPDRGGELDSCLIAVEHALLERRLAEKHPELPEILALRLKGLTVREIAERLDRSKATIERRLRAVDRICLKYKQTG